MHDSTCILLVEDDPNIVDLIRSNLAVRGFSVVVSTDGSDALRLVEEEHPDIALLDLMLPATDGFELCRQIRATSSIGVIVVSARGGESDKVRALNLGADDYMTKPFGIDELLARISATLRRTRPLDEPTAPEPVLRFGDLEIDLVNQSVTDGGEPVRLTPTEFALLREFATNPGRLLSHATLLRRVWGPGYATETEYTRVYVRRLRAKLERPGAPPLILTEPRAGYRFILGTTPEADTTARS
ncbi:MAG: response regulator transcription factor [Acidimicrobiales bacterium]